MKRKLRIHHLRNPNAAMDVVAAAAGAPAAGNDDNNNVGQDEAENDANEDGLYNLMLQ